ncbi:MAG: sigma 54-interacting transcriptional regulator [Deltaproteobacteria bacterium]|nr:sigma 54-interacting transcriptional regulator [Deltaproteobacteria bacterium]MBK8719212.1 sigma 54-interacting transcriptional regulator [Deltaproteobacteria bacterium]MBP7287593.1 sigma 54-interacting transcriptional regulator [Nannocystaceae bacterium]
MVGVDPEPETVGKQGANPPEEEGKLDRTTLRPQDIEAGLSRGYRLLVIGENQHTAHRLPRTGDVSLGRSDSADIQMPDPLMSRVHAVLHVGANLAISDLGSSNGTLVRGSRIPANERVPISVGDTIEVGSTVVIVQPEFARGVPPALERAEGADRTFTGPDDPMDRIYKLARRIAGSNINVLLLGETGVGKEVMARTLHSFSPRASKPFLGLNCASLSETLFESELFGYEKGAFTGAQQNKPGLIETADGGTVFLDELGEMPLSTQAKLLRVIEERQVMRVGSLRAREVDVRFIAATNQNLEKEIELGNFREDLFYRLNGISLVIPPLRERAGEIQGLARSFIAEACKQAGFGSQPVLSRDSVEWMMKHSWPGNIRELRNAVNRAVLLATGGVIQPEHMRTEAYSPRGGRGSGRIHDGRVEPAAPVAAVAAAPIAAVPAVSDPDEEERQRIMAALAACGGNQTRAAKILGIARRTLTSKLGKLGLPRPRKDREDADDDDDDE